MLQGYSLKLKPKQLGFKKCSKYFNLPSGKPTQLWNIMMFKAEIHNFLWPFSLDQLPAATGNWGELGDVDSPNPPERGEGGLNPMALR